MFTRTLVSVLGGIVVSGIVIGAVALASFGPRHHPASEPPPAGQTTGKPLVIVMSAAFVSEAGITVYRDIAQYLSEKTGTRCEFVSGLAYGTISEMLSTGAVDCGFVCGLPYVMLHDDRPAPAVRLLAAPVMRAPRYQGKPIYFSDLIVRADSPYRSLDDLRGKAYVYNEENSNSGYNMPRYRLLTAGYTSGFFGKVLRSGSHEESIRMVASGAADASYVDSLVLDFDREKNLGNAASVRVIESIGPAGICPIVVPTSAPIEQGERLQRALLDMHDDPRGRRILDQALLDRFVFVEDSDYDSIREMRTAADKAGFTRIR